MGLVEGDGGLFLDFFGVFALFGVGVEGVHEFHGQIDALGVGVFVQFRFVPLGEEVGDLGFLFEFGEGVGDAFEEVVDRGGVEGLPMEFGLPGFALLFQAGDFILGAGLFGRFELVLQFGHFVAHAGGSAVGDGDGAGVVHPDAERVGVGFGLGAGGWACGGDGEEEGAEEEGMGGFHGAKSSRWTGGVVLERGWCGEAAGVVGLTWVGHVVG